MKPTQDDQLGPCACEIVNYDLLGGVRFFLFRKVSKVCQNAIFVFLHITGDNFQNNQLIFFFFFLID